MSPQTYGAGDFRGAYSAYLKSQMVQRAFREYAIRYAPAMQTSEIGYDRNVSKEYQEQSAKVRRLGE